MVDLATLRVRRRARIAGAGAIAFDAADRALDLSAPGRRLVPLDPVERLASAAPIALGRNRGGGGHRDPRPAARSSASGGREQRAAVVDLSRAGA